jgi:hypothetical protein
VLGRIVLVDGPGVNDSARIEALAELRELLLGRIVPIFRGLFGVQVIEIAEELVEAVRRGQKLVQVAEVVLPDCPVA